MVWIQSHILGFLQRHIVRSYFQTHTTRLDLFLKGKTIKIQSTLYSSTLLEERKSDEEKLIDGKNKKKPESS